MRRGMLLAWIVLVGCGSDSLGGLGPVPTTAPSATAPPPTASSAPPIVDRDANPDNVFEASNVVEKQEAAATEAAPPPPEASTADDDAGAPAPDADSNPLAGWKVPLASCMNGQKQGCQGAPADEFCDSTGQCHTIDGGTGCQFQGTGPVFPQCAPGVLPCATATVQSQAIECCFFSSC